MVYNLNTDIRFTQQLLLSQNYKNFFPVFWEFDSVTDQVYQNLLHTLDVCLDDYDVVEDHIPKLNLYLFGWNLLHHLYNLLYSAHNVVYAVVWGKNFVFKKTSI